MELLDLIDDIAEKVPGTRRVSVSVRREPDGDSESCGTFHLDRNRDVLEQVRNFILENSSKGGLFEIRARSGKRGDADKYDESARERFHVPERQPNPVALAAAPAPAEPSIANQLGERVLAKATDQVLARLDPPAPAEDDEDDEDDEDLDDDDDDEDDDEDDDDEDDESTGLGSFLADEETKVAARSVMSRVNGWLEGQAKKLMAEAEKLELDNYERRVRLGLEKPGASTSTSLSGAAPQRQLRVVSGHVVHGTQPGAGAPPPAPAAKGEKPDG
jgi:hypothetical protein